MLYHTHSNIVVTIGLSRRKQATNLFQFTSIRMIGEYSLLPRNKRKVAEFTVGIALARLGPMLVKYLQNLAATSLRSVIVLPSDLNDEGRNGLFLCLFTTSFTSFQIVLRSFLASSSLES